MLQNCYCFQWNSFIDAHFSLIIEQISCICCLCKCPDNNGIMEKEKNSKYEYVLVGSTVKTTYYIIIIILESQKRIVNPDSKYIYIFQKTIQAVFLP